MTVTLWVGHGGLREGGENGCELSKGMVAPWLMRVKSNLLVIRMDVAGLTQWGASRRRERVCGRGGIRRNCGNLWKREKMKYGSKEKTERITRHEPK